MIKSFGDKRTQALFDDEFVKEFQGFARAAKRKLEAVNAASRLADLSIPPSTGWKSCGAISVATTRSGSTTSGG